MDSKLTLKVFCALAVLSVAGFAVADDAAGDNEMTDVVQTDDGNGDLTNQSIKGCDEEQQDACPCSESANEDKDPASSDPGAECVKFNIAMGRTRYSALTKSIMLQLNELTPNSALYSPSGFKVVAGFAVNSVSRVKNASGAPRYVTLTSTTGVPVTFEFADGESVGAPLMTTDNLADGRLAMADAQGWATASDPAYYDYYPGDGARWRFGAASLSPDYMQFVEHQTPEGRVETRQDLGLEIVRDAEGCLRQVATPAWVADFLVTGQDAYDLKVYPNDVSCIPGTRTADGFLVIAQDAVPDVAWEFRNPEPGVMRDLQVTKKRGTVSEAWLYKYVEDMRDFTLVYPNSVKEVRLERYSSDDKKSMLVRRSVLGVDGKAVAIREKLFDTSGKVGRVVKSVRDPGGLDLTRTYSYIQEGTCAGLRQEAVEENGSWTRYEYDDQRRLTARIRPWLDAPTNAPVNQCDVTRYSYVFVDPADFLHGNDKRARTETEEICGIEVARTYHAYPTNALGQVQEIEERAAFQGAPYGHASNRRTVKTYYAPSAAAHLAGRLASITYPGSKVEEYGYEYGTFNVAAHVFTSDPDGGAWRETVTTSYGANSGVQALRAARVWDDKGREVLNESYVEDGAAFALIGWKRISYNVNGQSVETAYSDGRVESATWGSNCCGMESKTAADGTTIVYGYNLLKQKISETKKGLAADGSGDITTFYTYELENRVLSTAVTNIASGLGYVASRNAYDSVGRATNTVDRLGNPTVTSYDTLVTSIHRPNGVTAVMERYLDGQTKRVLENGVVKHAYAYGVSPDGTRWTLSADGTLPAIDPLVDVADLRPLTSGLDFAWQIQVADLLGRTVATSKPGFGRTVLVKSNAYDIAGNLLRTERRVLGVESRLLDATLYAYDAAGNRAFTALDLNTNGVIDLEGPDRVTGTSSAYEKDAVTRWWQVSRSWVYPEFNSSAVDTTSIQRVQLAGLGAAQGDGGVLVAYAEMLDERGNVTVSEIHVDRTARRVTQFTALPISVQPEVQVIENGLLMQTVSSTAVTNSFGYDALSRQTTSTDGRGNTTTTVYNPLGLVAYTENAAGNRMTYGYDILGRRTSVTDALGNITHMQYDAAGRVIKTWGATYPVEYGYDTLSRMVSMRTFRDESGPSDETCWLYDQPTGLLTNKLYADGKGPSYSYTSDGHIVARTWSRLDPCTGERILTSYSYDASGSLIGIDYSDGTPGIVYTYDRLGGMATVTDASGTRTFSYTSDNQVLTEAVQFQNEAFTIHERYDTFGRSVGYALSNFVDGTSFQIAGISQSYDAFSRILELSVDGITEPFSYGWLSGADLQQSLVMPNGVTRQTCYDPHLDLLTSITHTNAVGSILTRRTFSYDDADRLTGRTQYRLGDGTNRLDSFDYNPRSELMQATHGTNVHSFAFDPIGNRHTASELGELRVYSANELNQYTIISNFVSLLPSTKFTPVFDLDGNQTWLKTSTGIWHVDYNAENRPICFSNGTTVVEMAYDFMGRRLEYKEKVNGTITCHERFLYRNYLQIAAIDLISKLNAQSRPVRVVAWDPAEPIATRPLCLLSGTNWWCYGFDQAKSVTELFHSSSVIAAKYDYTPFGAEMISGDYAATLNSLGFSSEFADSVLGLLYFNYRHYNPMDGRWLTRDPLGERAGGGLYVMIKNNPVTKFDMLGLESVSIYNTDGWGTQRKALPGLACETPLGFVDCAA